MNKIRNFTTFDAAVSELTPSLLRFLERYVGNRAIAEELLQESLLRINKGLPSFVGRSSLKTWSFSIACRVAADYLRSKERKTQIVAFDTIEEPIDPNSGIDKRIVVNEMNQCVRDVIDSLPEPYRAALILHDLEGLSVEQTSAICKCSVSTAKIRIHRARNRLKEAMAKQCSFYRDEENVFRCDRKV